MKTLITVLTLAMTSLGINAQETQLEKDAAQILSNQMATVSMKVENQLRQDIKFVTYSLKMPLVSEQNTLVAKVEKTEKKEIESE